MQVNWTGSFPIQIFPKIASNTGTFSMYELILIIGLVTTGTPTGPTQTIGVTSQSIGKFKSLDECQAAAEKPKAGGPIPGFALSATWGGYWYCAYTGRM